MTEPTVFSKEEFRALAKLAVPLAAVQIGNTFLGVTDTAIVGRLGAVQLGAVGLGHAVFFAVSIVGNGIMMGLDPLVSQALGARDEVRARTLLWQSFWLALAVGCVLSVPLFLIAPCLDLFGVDAQVARACAPYLAVRSLGLIPTLFFLGVRSYLQAKGRTGSLVAGIVAANLCNVAITWLLAFGGAGLPGWAGPLRAVPALGATGAAVASTFCVILQFVIVVWALRGLRVEGFAAEHRRLRLPDVKRAFRVGLPIGLQMAAEVGIFTIVALIAGGMGPTDLAAHQIAITLAGLTFSCSLGIGAAGSVRVGTSVGAGCALATRRAGFTAFLAGGSFMALSALCFFLWPEWLAALLSSDPEVIRAAAPLVSIAAFFQLSDGIQAIGAGVLRGAGDTRMPFVTNLIGHYAIGLPVALALGVWGGQGVMGLWWGLCAGLTAVGVTLFTRFYRLSKRTIQPLGALESTAA